MIIIYEDVMMKWCYHNDFISQYIWFVCLKTLFNGVMRQCHHVGQNNKQQGKIDQHYCWMVIVSIADICHHRRWFIFSSRCPFLHKERKILAK